MESKSTSPTYPRVPRVAKAQNLQRTRNQIQQDLLPKINREKKRQIRRKGKKTRLMF